MVKRNVLFYWLLIGVPAVILTGTAIFFLFRVQSVLAELNSSVVRTAALDLAAMTHGWVAQQNDRLARALDTAPENQLVESLCEIRRTNPLVRNVFVWEKGKGLTFPEKGSLAVEDQLFLGRYQRVFPAGHIWTVAEEEGGDASRVGLNRWVDADGLQFVVWRQVSDSHTIGIEVEMTALLARVLLLAPDSARKFGAAVEGVTLTDSQGRLAQHGNVPDTKEARACYTVPVSPSLCPTWELSVYSPALGNGGDKRIIMAIGGILVFLLTASLFAGGFLFARAAARERRDALQKTTFVSNVSHELKTPLTNIRLYAELLADGHAKTPEAHQQYLGVIVTESERLTRLINNVLDFGRLEQHRRVFHPEATGMADWLKTATHALRGITDDAGMTVAVACPPDLRVYVDRDALSQVFLNVIDNACKYAKAGKVIDITLDAVAGGKAVFALSDRGPGLEPGHAQRVFQRFFRADDSTTASVGGCGLGLSIAKQLMQGMGGDIRWRPRDGGGSTFLLSLPLPPET